MVSHLSIFHDSLNSSRSEHLLEQNNSPGRAGTHGRRRVPVSILRLYGYSEGHRRPCDPVASIRTDCPSRKGRRRYCRPASHTCRVLGGKNCLPIGDSPCRHPTVSMDRTESSFVVHAVVTIANLHPTNTRAFRGSHSKPRIHFPHSSTRGMPSPRPTTALSTYVGSSYCSAFRE